MSPLMSLQNSTCEPRALLKRWQAFLQRARSPASSELPIEHFCLWPEMAMMFYCIEVNLIVICFTLRFHVQMNIISGFPRGGEGYLMSSWVDRVRVVAHKSLTTYFSSRTFYLSFIHFMQTQSLVIGSAGTDAAAMLHSVTVLPVA